MGVYGKVKLLTSYDWGRGEVGEKREREREREETGVPVSSSRACSKFLPLGPTA
jgi:hypothetical protein